MKAITKYYLKIFFVVGLIFGSIQIVSKMLIFQNFDFLGIVITTLLFAIIFATIIVPIQILGMKQQGLEMTEENFKMPFKKEISSPLSKQELISKIKQDASLKNMTMTEIPNGISMLSGFSFFTLGEKIRIHVEKDGDHNRFNISSRSVYKINLVDHGKNAKYVNKLIDIIQKT